MKVNNLVSSSIWYQEKNTTFRFGARHVEMDKLQIWNQVYYRTKSSFHQNHRQMLDSSHVIQMKLKSASKDLPKGILLVLISCGKMEQEKLDINIYKSTMKERFEIKLNRPEHTRTVRTNRRDLKISRTVGVCVSKDLNCSFLLWPTWLANLKAFLYIFEGRPSFDRTRIIPKASESEARTRPKRDQNGNRTKLDQVK